MKTYAMHATVKAESQAQAIHKIEKEMVNQGLEGTFTLSEVPPTLNTIVVTLTEFEMPMFTLVFRKNAEGTAQAEAAFELLLLKLGFLEGLEDDDHACTVDAAMETGQAVWNGKILTMTASSTLEDIEELSELIDSMGDVDDDYSKMDA